MAFQEVNEIMNDKNTMIINIIGGPGSRKSTLCAGIFTKLKILDINCEMALEYAKDIVWEESFKKLENQFYIFGKQLQRIKRLHNKVDVIITDSPLILSIVYDIENNKTFQKLVLEEFNKFNNTNFLVERNENYKKIGRIQTLEQAKTLDKKIKIILDDNDISYDVIDGHPNNIEYITDKILKQLQN